MQYPLRKVWQVIVTLAECSIRWKTNKNRDETNKILKWHSHSELKLNDDTILKEKNTWTTEKQWKAIPKTDNDQRVFTQTNNDDQMKKFQQKIMLGGLMMK